MPEPTRLPLAKVSRLISSNFTDDQRQFAASFVFYFNKRIKQRKNIAEGGDANQGMSKIKRRFFMIAIPAITAMVMTGVGILTAGAVIPLLVILLSGTISVLMTVLPHAFMGLAKRRIKQKASLYNKFLPKDLEITKLFSQLMSLSMATELQTLAISNNKISTLYQKLKKGIIDIIDRVIGVKKIPGQAKKSLIQMLANEKFKEIWGRFKWFVQEIEKDGNSIYGNNTCSTRITNLFNSYCDLGDATDKSEIANDSEINIFWVNLFVRYLAEKDVAVRESVLAALESKFNGIPEASSSASFSSQFSSSSEIGSSDSLSSASFSSQFFSSSEIDLSDSLASQTSIVYAPRFFASQVANEESLPANNQESEQLLGSGTRL